MASKTAQIVIIEIDKSDGKPLGTPKELAGAILGLGAQLGFQEILRRFRVARSILQTRLGRPEEDENRWQLRALIDAYGFVERQLRQESGRPVEPEREAYEDEKREYERLSQFIQIVR